MKFLCVPCDKPMTLIQTRPPHKGSMSLVYECADCGYEMAMLTNPHETEVVGSLGVQLGSASENAGEGASKCPFTGMVQEMAQAGDVAATGFPWTAGARSRLEAIPAFVRPMAKTGIEKYARDKGLAEVDEGLLDEAREFFGM